MQQRVRNHNHIEIMWNTKVTQFGGDAEGLADAATKEAADGRQETSSRSALSQESVGLDDDNR